MLALAIHRHGDPQAPAVLLLHGLSEAGTNWPDLVTRWGDRWSILAADLRGHGRSPRFTQEQLAAPADVMLADVLAVVDAQADPVAIVGHSLGGLLALRAALARPRRVWALVLEDPARPSPWGGPNLALGAEVLELLTATDEDRSAEVARMHRETAWSDAEIKAWADGHPLVDREFVRRGLDLGDPAWEEAFEALAVPTLLVRPADSSMAPHMSRIRNPLVREVVVEGAGHCVRRDRPDAYHGAVDAFLAEHVASGVG